MPSLLNRHFKTFLAPNALQLLQGTLAMSERTLCVFSKDVSKHFDALKVLRLRILFPGNLPGVQ